MTHGEPLTEREHVILEAVIRTYVDTAEPAGSRTVARRFNLDVSPATVRNTMSDLEEKGYLFHPHTSAGRVPTDQAYRFYVDALLRDARLPAADRRAIRRRLSEVRESSPVEQLIQQAAKVVGLLTQELGIAIAPVMDQAVLERLDLVALAEGKVLFVLTLRAGGVRTIYVDVPAVIPHESLQAVATVLNERLAGLSLHDIRATLPERIRDGVPSADPRAAELLNVFLQQADEWLAPPGGGGALHLGQASVLAEQPEFKSGERLRSLIELTDRRDLLKRFLGDRLGSTGLQITIGAEHDNPALADFTVVTSEYRLDDLRGVIGVIGPTRMPYDRIIAFVESTSAMVSEILA